MIPLLHAGLTATIYIVLRELFPMPWLWPLDDGLWLAGAAAILIGWGCLARQERTLARGGIIGLTVAVIAIVALGALFPVIARFWLSRMLPPRSGDVFYGIALAAWFVAAFLLAVAALAGGVAAGAVARRRGLAALLTIAAMIVPLTATWSHAVLGIGLLEIGRCRARLPDGLAAPLQPPRVIVVGIRADCFGQPVQGGKDSN